MERPNPLPLWLALGTIAAVAIYTVFAKVPGRSKPAIELVTGKALATTPITVAVGA